MVVLLLLLLLLRRSIVGEGGGGERGGRVVGRDVAERGVELRVELQEHGAS